MHVFKVKLPADGPDTMSPDDDFYKFTHGDCNRMDYTLCGIGSEEFEEAGNRKRITCPECLALIAHVKTYLPNVKEPAPLSAGASVDHGVGVETTEEHENSGG